MSCHTEYVFFCAGASTGIIVNKIHLTFELNPALNAVRCLWGKTYPVSPSCRTISGMISPPTELIGTNYAASFSCRSVTANDEQTICVDRELSEKNVRMAATYVLRQKFRKFRAHLYRASKRHDRIKRLISHDMVSVGPLFLRRAD